MSKKLSFCSLCVLPVLTVLVFFSVGSLQVSASDDLENLDILWFSEDFKEVFPFSEGYANFKDESGKYGVIDLNGKVLLPPTYEYMTPFLGGHAAFYQGKLKGIMDKSFKVVVEPFKSNNDSDSEIIWENRPIFEGYSTFKEGDKVGLLDPNGKVVIPAKYEYKDATESKGKVKVDEKDVSLKAYLIGGNNYYKLRDLAKELNFKVNWNEDKKRIEVEF